MDCDSHSIVSTVVVDKREVNLRSPNMEKLALERSLTLLSGTLQITELVTDAHTQIVRFLCELKEIKQLSISLLALKVVYVLIYAVQVNMIHTSNTTIWTVYFLYKWMYVSI